MIKSGLFAMEQNFVNVYDFNNAYSMTPDRTAQASKERIWVIKYSKNFELNGFGDDEAGFMSNEGSFPIDRGNENARFAWCASGYQKLILMGSARAETIFWVAGFIPILLRMLLTFLDIAQSHMKG